MRFKLTSNVALLALVTLAWSFPASAQSTADGIAKYRQMLADDNPSDLAIAKGEELWKTARGPKNVSFKSCDLGVGPGVVKGAYVQTPRYFADTNRVQDIESRLITCMTTLQGMSEADAMKSPFGPNSDMQALVAYVASESRGLKMAAPMSHPKEQEAYAVGKQIFFFRGGTHDFACATCHSAADGRIRLQNLPNLLDNSDAQNAYGTWPGYRVSQGEVRTMQHRLWDCFRQQRFPEVKYTSDAITALTMYLAKNAEGGTFRAPSVKR
ncbi:sulfur oxidation c-type cytochrome SoxA [soil metagenome]